MNITRVRVSKVESTNGKLIGYADVTVNNALAIHNIKIIKGDEKNFIAFPSTKNYDKETGGVSYFDIAHPVNQETRKKFEDAIFAEFDKLAE